MNLTNEYNSMIMTEMMGTETTEQQAEAMRDHLIELGYDDTDDITDAVWLAALEAVAK
jgi:hypothetical protein